MRHYEVEDSIKGKCFTLTSLILAHYDVVDMYHPYNEYWCIFSNDFKSKFKATFMMELIGLAGLLRVLMDVESFTVPVGDTEFGFDQSVGTLNLDNSQEPLSFREACNKIIHAASYEIELEHTSHHPLFNGKNGYEFPTREFKNPVLITHGEYNKKKWESKLNFMRFIDISMNLISYND